MNTARIGDVAELNPRAPREVLEAPAREVNFVPMSQLSEHGTLACNGTRLVRDVSKGYTYFANGDILVAKITPCLENGKAALVSGLSCGVAFGSTEFHVLRPRDNIESRYLFYMLWNPIFRQAAARNMTGTAGQKRVPTSFLENFRIPLPVLEKQKRIADTLDKADAIRAKRSDAATIGNRLHDAAFRQFFSMTGNAAPPNATKTLAEVTSVHGGIALSARRDRYSLKVPYLRVANVYRGRLDLSEIKEVGVTEDEFRKALLEKGDILIVEGHGNRHEIGRAAVWDGSIEPCLHQNHLIRVKARREVVSNIYLAAFLNSDDGRRQLFRHGKTTSGLNTISISQVRQTRLLVPPMERQVDFEHFISAQAAAVSRLNRAEGDARALFESLTERAFRGEL